MNRQARRKYPILSLTAIIILAISLLCTGSLQAAELPGVTAVNYCSFVDPWIGVRQAWSGNTVLGPQVPNGSINPAPDTKNPQMDGYEPDQDILGISQTHASGIGGPAYGHFPVSPRIGTVTLTNKDFAYPRSSVVSETATPSLYSVTFKNPAIKISVTPTSHAAIYEMVFPRSGEAVIPIAVSSGIPIGERVKACHVEIDTKTKTKMNGFSAITAWGSTNPIKIYFAAKFSKPATAYGTWSKRKLKAGNSLEDLGATTQGVGAFFKYSTKSNEKIYMKIAISMKSIQQAESFLNKEIPAWDFNRVKAACEKQWNAELGRIRIEGASPEQSKIFYTALYHSMLMPRNRTGDNPNWTSAAPYYDDHFAGWDTWRTVFPLHMIIRESFVRDNVKAFLDRWSHNKKCSDAYVGGYDGWEQGGHGVDNMIADAYLKGLDGFDWNAVYNSIIKGHAESKTIDGPSYFFDRTRVDVSAGNKGVEYRYNDYCAALMAKGLGKTDDYVKYATRSRNWETEQWDPNAADVEFKGFLKYTDGSTNYRDAYSASKKYEFYEGSSWMYSFTQNHDHARMIELMGGKEKFVQRLQYAYDNNLINLWNEPNFLTPYSYIYAGRPDLASLQASRIRTQKFSLNGYPGDDDSGAMSSWYIFMVSGFMPNAGQNLYLLNGPMLGKVSFRKENGKTFTVEGENVSDKNIYVQSATLNGKPLDKAWIMHEDIRSGGTLHFVMGDKPTDWGKANPPPSLDLSQLPK